MAYISGNFVDFENRLHQLPVSQSDLNNFISEGCSYYSQMNSIGLGYLIRKWNKEFYKKGYNYDVLGDGCLSYLLSPDGTNILDVNGSPIISVS